MYDNENPNKFRDGGKNFFTIGKPSCSSSVEISFIKRGKCTEF